MIKGYYNKKRFWNFPDDWKCIGDERIKKTASFYEGKINFYIDSSDGVNEDLGVDEFMWRIEEIVNECNGKPFIVFKTSYSEVHSKKLKEFAQKHNGDVQPFFLWSYYQDFKYLLDNRERLLKIKNDTEKVYDIGFISSLRPYDYPDGKGDLLKINTRQEIFDKLQNSNFSFSWIENLPFEEYLKRSFQCKLVLNVPGIGEYSGRMLEAWALGQALVLRSNTYDNAISYKHYVPEIDFNSRNWENELRVVVDNYKHVEEQSKIYWDMVYGDSEKIFDYIKEKI